MKFTAGNFYVVRWLDAAEQDDQDSEEFGSVMQTAGWVYKSNRYGVRLGNERYKDKGDYRYRGITDIPRKIIMDAQEVEVDE